MANFLFIRHKVRDFAEWKKSYDTHKSKRAEAGLREVQLLRSAADPNEVFMLFFARDAARAKTFTESVDLKEAMEKAGVVNKPDIHFLID